MSDKSARMVGPRKFAIMCQSLPNGVKPKDLPAELAGLDVWNLRRNKSWWSFDGRLPDARHTRSYRMKEGSGVILAATEAPVMGLFELGGQSAAYATAGDVPYPYNIFTADDDIGPVGMAGLETAAKTDGLSRLRERTVAALVAQTLLRWCEDSHQQMPLYYVRTETDSSASAAEVAEEQATANLSIAMGNWRAAAKAINRPAALLGLIVDVAGDDLGLDYAQGLQDLINALRSIVGAARPARIFMTFDVGDQIPIREDMIQAQQECTLSTCGPDTVMVAPGYMFKHEPCGWLSDTGRLHKAEMIAAAMTYVPPQAPPGIGGQVEEGWICPVPLLADWEDGTIRVTCRSATKTLVIDPHDPFAAGKHAGFALYDPKGSAQIRSVAIDPEDNQSVLIRCEGTPGHGARLFYAAGAAPDPGRRFPVNTGCVRDDWHMLSADGSDLHRWMLPCVLTIGGV